VESPLAASSCISQLINDQIKPGIQPTYMAGSLGKGEAAALNFCSALSCHNTFASASRKEMCIKDLDGFSRFPAFLLGMPRSSAAVATCFTFAASCCCRCFCCSLLYAAAWLKHTQILSSGDKITRFMLPGTKLFGKIGHVFI